MKKLFVIALLLVGLAPLASAQTDLRIRIATTALTAATTNTTAMTSPIGWNRDAVIVVQTTLTGTNVIAGTNIVFKFDVSNDKTYWLATQHTISATFPGNGTVTTITRLTNSVGGKWLRLKSMENINPAGGSVTINTFNYSE